MMCRIWCFVTLQIVQIVLRVTGSDLSFEDYPDLETINSYIFKVAAKYSDFVQVESIGKTHENRDIHLVKITSPKNRHSVWIDAGQNHNWDQILPHVIFISRKIVHTHHVGKDNGF